MIPAADDLTEKVIKRMHEGMAPSRIDVVLGLKPGEAHRIMVGHWALDKRMAGSGRSIDRYRK